jgi:hypothetical protein
VIRTVAALIRILYKLAGFRTRFCPRLAMQLWADAAIGGELKQKFRAAA